MKQNRPILLMFALLLAAALACGLPGGAEEPTAETQEQPTAEPTTLAQSEAPSPTEAPAEPSPTTEVKAVATEPPAVEETPAVEDTPTEAAPPGAAFELDSSPYVHPQGIFEILAPQGWAVDEADGTVSFNAPDERGFVNIEVTDTGFPLDEASFERFVDARDLNLFGDFDGYEVVNRKIDASLGLASTTKGLLFDGIPQIVTTVYDQYDQVIYALDFWAEEELAPAYGALYDEINVSLAVDNVAAAEQLDSYAWIYDFYGPADLFEIEVPLPWRYELDEGEVAIVDTFYSPDEHGIIQNITYDDGEETSRSEAGAFALELLKSYYADDILISDDRVQPDGSERLSWSSPGGDYSGISFLETRGTTFLLFSVLWDNPYEDAYLDVLDYTIGSYLAPE
jgi:hypothetical protein